MVTVDTDLKNYILEKEIGRGDLTIVYQGRRKSDDAIVAIKTVAPQFTFDELFVRRFQDITRQSIRLEHPNIVRTYETDQDGDTPFVVRELITGRTLALAIKEEGPFSPQRMLKIAEQLAAALDYAHQKSIMHGDLSAKRVYVDQDDQVTVADFGQIQAIVGTSLAKQGYAIGSPEILAPERVRGQGPSRQSDLYSLGILCYQMLNLDPPFVGEPAAVLHAQAYEQPRPLHVVNPDISIALSEAIGRMLSKGLELRYSTGSEFTRALSVAAQGTAPVRVTGNTDQQFEVLPGGNRPVWQRPWLWALIALPIVIFLLVAGFLAVSVWSILPAILGSETVDSPAQATVAQVAPSPSPVSAAAQQPGSDSVILVDPTATAEPSLALTSTPLSIATAIPPTATATPTLLPIPTPGPPVVIDGSPFTNLTLAHSISDENQPERVGTYFAPGSQPIYLFFEYGDIKPGTVWKHRWTWADTELDIYEDVWPDSYFETGTAWVFYNPAGGYQPGPYKVTLEVNGQTVGTATFVIQDGGL